MHAGHHYPLRHVLRWTWRDIARHLAVALAATAGYEVLGWRWLAVPWLPIALLGTAVAFLVGFKNNASYDRVWEARRVWGSIVNGSRAWALLARDFVSDLHAVSPASPHDLAAARRALYLRHFAWLTAMRHQLREPRAWEAANQPHNAAYRRRWFQVDEHEHPMGPAVGAYLTPDEHTRVMAAGNKAAHILSLQSEHVAGLRRAGWIDDLRHIEMQRCLAELLAQQGASERIKNFPYPRQYATINLWFVQLFVLLIPLGLLQEFEKLGGPLVWLSVPFSALTAWVFTTMEKIGESSESPFEGSANDVPITAMSRAVEIDMRQMLDGADVPAPIAPVNHILM